MVRIITLATGLASILALVEAEQLSPRYAPFPKHIKKRVNPVNSTIVVETTIVHRTITETEGQTTSDSGITITKQTASPRSATTTSSTDDGNPILSAISAATSLGESVVSSALDPSPSPQTTTSKSSSTTSSSAAGNPDPDPSPSPSPSSTSNSPDPSPSSSSSSPGGIVIPVTSAALSLVNSATSAIGGAASSATSALGSVVSSATSTIGGVVAPSSSNTPAPVPSSSSTTAAAGPGPDPSPSSSSSSPGGIVIPGTSAALSLVNSVTSAVGSVASSATSQLGAGLGPSSSPATVTTPPPAPTPSSSQAGGDPLSSLVNSVTASLGSQASSALSSLTGSPPPNGQPSVTNSPASSSTPPVNSNPLSSILSSVTSALSSAATGIPVGTGSSSASLPVSLSLPSGSLPSGSLSLPSGSLSQTSLISTSLPVSLGPSGSSASASPASSSTSASAAVVSPPSSAAPTSTTPTQAYPSTGPQSIKPTATDTLTSIYMPTTVIVDTTASTAASSVATASGIPSSLPGQLQNPFTGGTIPPQPVGNTLCNFAFTKELDYTFVVSTPYAVKEIFYYTPKAIQYGLNTTDSTVPQMHTLRPYDTSSSGYITTLAYFWLPDNYVDNLQAQLLAANSWFHKNQSNDPQTDTFITLVDTSFPLRAANLNSPTSNPSSPTSQPNPINIGSSGSSVNPTAVGAGVGAVAGAALYGAIMFFVARRYRKRRAGHSRSSSVIDTSSMAQSHREMTTGAGSALMAGHDGYYGTNGRISRESGSSRGRDISAPMMAENSLGWN